MRFSLSMRTHSSQLREGWEVEGLVRPDSWTSWASQLRRVRDSRRRTRGAQVPTAMRRKRAWIVSRRAACELELFCSQYTYSLERNP